MKNGAIEGFLDTHNPGKLSLISAHYFACVKLLTVSQVPQTTTMEEKP
jgi:hypothetical protein